MESAGCGVTLPWAQGGMEGQTELCKGPRSSGTRAGSAGELADGGEGFEAELYVPRGREDQIRELAPGMELRWWWGVLRRNLGHGQWLP